MSRRRLLLVLAAALAAGLAYLLAWPVPIDPVAWQAPTDPGYTGDFAENRRLADIELFPLSPDHGPEDLAVDAAGRVYAAMSSGAILRFDADGRAERWSQTDGRPLGIEFAPGPVDGQTLYVADAYRGLLAIGPDRMPKRLLDAVDGVPLLYADDVDVAADGTVYLSDASTKFGAEAFGGTYPASVLDINEHGGHGRLIAYDPSSGEARTVLDGLQFANGVCLSHDERSVLVAESGNYRVIRWWRTGPKAGTVEPVLGPLPGFPDNVARGRDGRYWVGLISPRSPALDMGSGSPFLRRLFERLPAAVKPKARPRPHVVAFDDSGRVVADLQDPDGPFAFITGAVEVGDHIYLSSLRAENLARVPAAVLGERAAGEEAR